MSTDQPAHVPQELRSWAADAFGSEYALSPIQLAIGGAVLDSVWSQGIAEGRRQATEGWDREWGVQFLPDGHVFAADDEAEAHNTANRDVQRFVVSRLVGPWEPAEQPEDGAR